MTTTSILLLVVALIPLAGNLLALVLRRYGKNSAADWVVRMTPLAVVAASSKSREEAIARLTEEVMKLTGPESIPAQVVARDVLTKSVPPPPTAASLLPLVCVALALHASGCTPQQAKDAQTAASVALEHAPEVIGGACEIAELLGGGKTARVICKVLQSGGDGVMHDMSSGPGSVEARPPKYASFSIIMTREEAEAFVAKNGGAK